MLRNRRESAPAAEESRFPRDVVVGPACTENRPPKLGL